MRISAFFMPLFAMIAGIIGIYLRLSERWSVFDVRTGLAERGAGATYILIGFSVFYLSLVLLFAIRASKRHEPRRGFEKAFGTGQLSYPSIFFIIGLVWLSATVTRLIDLAATGPLQTTEIYFSVLSILSSISVTFFAIEMYQGSKRKVSYFLSVVPTVFACFWLILIYRENASNPVLLSYAYYCLAIIAATLGFYFTSGFVYDKPSTGMAIFTYYAAIYFGFVTLADSHSMNIRLIIAAIIAANFVHSSMLIKNLRRKRPVQSIKEPIVQQEQVQ